MVCFAVACPTLIASIAESNRAAASSSVAPLGEVGQHLGMGQIAFPSSVELGDVPGVVRGVDDRSGLSAQPGEVLIGAEPSHVEVGRQHLSHRKRVCWFPGLDQHRDGLEDPLMDRLVEVFRPEIGAHPESSVVGQQTAEQRLLFFHRVE